MARCSANNKCSCIYSHLLYRLQVHPQAGSGSQNLVVWYLVTRWSSIEVHLYSLFPLALGVASSVLVYFSRCAGRGGSNATHCISPSVFILVSHGHCHFCYVLIVAASLKRIVFLTCMNIMIVKDVVERHCSHSDCVTYDIITIVVQNSVSVQSLVMQEWEVRRNDLVNDAIRLSLLLSSHYPVRVAMEDFN